jgi:YD repeat-containing protein
MDYDAHGRLVLQTLPNGATKSVTFAPLAQTVASLELAPVTSELDGLQRIVRTHRTIGSVVETVDAHYDAAGRVLGMSLQGGEAVHSFVYDTLGRLTRAEDPDTGRRDLVYDDANFLKQHTNGEGETVFFDYDNAGRLKRRGFTLNPNPPTDYAYEYDSASSVPAGCHVISRLAAVTEPAGAVHFCYDELGRQVGMARTIGPGKTGALTTTMTVSGLVLTETYDDGFATSNRYDAAGRLVAISFDGAERWIADGPNDLDATGRVLHERYGSGATQDYTYGALGLTETTTVKPPSSSTPLFDITVTRNTYGAPTLVADNVSTGLDHRATYSYDPAGRLEGSTLGAAGVDQFAFTFTYDALQNMKTRTVTGPKDIGVLTGTYKYGERGYGPRQLTSVNP